MKIRGVSIIPGKFTNSSTEGCAHSATGSQVRVTAPQLLCLAAGVPPEQHPYLKRQRKILITAFNPPAFHGARRAPGFLEGWFIRFCSRQDLFAFYNVWDSGTETRGSLSFSRPTTHTLLLAPWAALVWHTLFAPALSQCLVGSRQKGQCHPTTVGPSRDQLGERSLECSFAGDNARRWGCSSPAEAKHPALRMTRD